MGKERRRTPRIEATRPVTVRPSGFGTDFSVIDLSLGGFRARGPLPLTAGATFIFKFVGDDHSGRVPLAAKVVFCRQLHDGPKKLFEMGLEFVKGDSAATAARVALLEHLISVFEFERSVSADEQREQSPEHYGKREAC